MFKDRIHAGQLLAERLVQYKSDDNVIVLAIPRGGIVPAYVISSALNVSLDILLVKKIGHPNNKEYAIGAVSLDHHIITAEEYISSEYIEQETLRVRANMAKQYKMFLGDRTPLSLSDKTVILVDDGIATGNTFLMALEIVKQAKPKAVIIAVPVAPKSVIEAFKKKVDEVTCLETPYPFRAVGAHYQHFDQVENETVVQLLNK